MMAVLKKIVKKNSICYRDGEIIPAQRGVVNLNGWYNLNHPDNNIGDILSHIIVEKCKEYFHLDETGGGEIKHLYAVGSVLLGWQDATVWGSGFLNDLSKKRYFKELALLHRISHKTDVRAVRGPRSKHLFDKIGIPCPEVYGDPAILMPLFYKPSVEMRKDYIVIPHYQDSSRFQNDSHVMNTFVEDYSPFIDNLVASELVISSSLHGIILAEAYGVPAILLKNEKNSNMYKYYDYYESTGRFQFPIVHSVEEALQTSPSIPDRSRLNCMQDELLKAFPTDLWKAAQ